MRKSFTLTAAIVLALAASVLAMPGKGAGMPGCPMAGGMEGGFMPGARMILAMASELNLTADQMAALKKIIDAAPDKKEMKEAMKDEHADIRAELAEDKPHMAKIDAMIDKIADGHKAKLKMKAKHAVEISSILTKEQKEILKKKFADKKEMKKGKCPMSGK